MDELYNLSWCDFEKKIGKFIRDESIINQINHTTDDGIDVITTREDKQLGFIKVLWQIKRYEKTKLVDIKIVKDFGFLISELNAARGIILTTSNFTKNASRLIQSCRDIILGLHGNDAENLVYGRNKVNDDGSGLPF